MRNKVTPAWLIVIGIILGSGWGANSASAQPAVPAPPEHSLAVEQQNARRQTLVEDKAEIDRLRQEIDALSQALPRQLEALRSEPVSENTLKQAQFDLEGARLSQQNLQINIANSERTLGELEQQIRELEAQVQLLQNPAKNNLGDSERLTQLARARTQLKHKQTDLELEKQHLENLRRRAELAARRLALAEEWEAQVAELYRLQQERDRQLAQEDLQLRLQKRRQEYQEEARALRQQLEQEREHLSETQIRSLESRIKNADGWARLMQEDMRLAAMVDELARLESLLNEQTELKKLRQAITQVRELQKDLRTSNELFAGAIALTERRLRALAEVDGLTHAQRQAMTTEAEVVEPWIEAMTERLERIVVFLAQADDLETRLEAYYRDRVSRDLLVRKPLPGSLADWQALLDGVIQAYQVLFYQMRLSVESAIQATTQIDVWRWLQLVALELLVIGGGVVGHYYLRQVIRRVRQRESDSFIGSVTLTALRLLRRNLGGLVITAALLLAVWWMRVPQPGLGIIFTVALLWVGVKIPVNFAWLLFASPELPAEYRRPQLYQRLVWTLVPGGVVAGLAILAHLSALPEMVINTFDRLFMLYWLFIAWTIVPLRRYLIDLLATRHGEEMWFVSLRVLSVLMPLSLFAAAILGIVGYLTLAWEIAWHLVVFIAVVIGWLGARNLLNDMAVFCKNFAVAHSSYCLLWTQDVINPLHRLLRIGLFIGMWPVLFMAYGWDNDSQIVIKVWEYLERPLFTLGGTAITPWRIILTGAILYIVIWFGQWCRTVTYRWILFRIADMGVRHSLSVFTQYFIVLVGFLITLQVAGVNLTTLTVFAGAVGVGIGFGMQAIANNFISGLILLVERPLRSGDTVQIGTNTGKVSRIGMRSLTLETWDKMEVIIPNSDIITNAFTNWTHSDNIVRTVLMVGVRYDADPHKAKAVMDKVLEGHKAILADPKWSVLLWEFNDSVLKFRVQYFIDFFNSNILNVQSEVMFAIYDGLKAAGIKLPNAQRDLHIKEWPEVSLVRREEINPPVLEKIEPVRASR